MRHYATRTDNGRNMPIFEKSGLLEEVKKRPTTEFEQPVDSISPVTFFKSHSIEPSQRPLLKATLYRKGSSTIINQLDLGSKSCYLIGGLSEDKKSFLGNNSIIDISVPDGYCSKHHCVIQFRKINDKLTPYLMDLDSVNVTTLNSSPIPTRRYVELSNNDVISFSSKGTNSEFEIIYQEGNQ